MSRLKRVSQRTSYSSLAELNVTPLIDLAFVLLIIFIITTPLLEKSIPLNLPTGESESQEVQTESVKTIEVGAQGQIYLDKVAMSKSQLVDLLQSWHQQDPEASVVLRIDRQVPFQRANDVFDALNQAGISRMAIVNREPNE